MMEEYVEVSREEATPELQIVAIQEERVETRTEIGQQQEESRKRKRNEDEEETKQGKDLEIDDFVSKRELVVMEQTLCIRISSGKEVLTSSNHHLER